MTEKLILLPTGDALRSDGDPSRDVRREAADANAVTASVDARVIVVAGPKDSGKTTLVSSLYQQFLMNQQFAHFSFVSSRTLRAWELRCRLARVSSGGLSPDSARTLVAEEGNFLHLRLRGVESSDTVDLLLSDWPYETFARRGTRSPTAAIFQRSNAQIASHCCWTERILLTTQNDRWRGRTSSRYSARSSMLKWSAAGRTSWS